MSDTTKSVDEELFMDAYYYSFERTGVIEIDRILSAVAIAGKRYHNTEDWQEDMVGAIQKAANDAAQLFAKQLEEAEIRHLAKRLYVALTEQRVIDCSKYGPGVYAQHTFEDCYLMLAQDTKGGTDEGD